MIPIECKRLAEVDFPIPVVSKHAAREKSIRHGHPSTLHLRWARRPLASSRAVLMALLRPDRITIASFPGPNRSISLTELQTGSFVTRRYRNRRINEDRTYFATILPVHPAVESVNERYTRQVTPHSTTEETTGVTTEVRVLTEVERALLEFCREPRHSAEIQLHLVMCNERHLRGRYLQPLLEQGLLERTQPESPRSPTQQYRTTALGLAALAG